MHCLPENYHLATNGCGTLRYNYAFESIPSGITYEWVVSSGMGFNETEPNNDNNKTIEYYFNDINTLSGSVCFSVSNLICDEEERCVNVVNCFNPSYKFNGNCEWDICVDVICTEETRQVTSKPNDECSERGDCGTEKELCFEFVNCSTPTENYTVYWNVFTDYIATNESVFDLGDICISNNVCEPKYCHKLNNSCDCINDDRTFVIYVDLSIETPTCTKSIRRAIQIPSSAQTCNDVIITTIDIREGTNDNIVFELTANTLCEIDYSVSSTFGLPVVVESNSEEKLNISMVYEELGTGILTVTAHTACGEYIYTKTVYNQPGFTLVDAPDIGFGGDGVIDVCEDYPIVFGWDPCLPSNPCISGQTILSITLTDPNGEIINIEDNNGQFVISSNNLSYGEGIYILTITLSNGYVIRECVTIVFGDCSDPSLLISFECIDTNQPILAIQVLSYEGESTVDITDQFTFIDTISGNMLENGDTLINGTEYNIVAIPNNPPTPYGQLDGGSFIPDCSTVGTCNITLTANYEPCLDNLTVNVVPIDSTLLLDGYIEITTNNVDIELSPGIHTITATHPEDLSCVETIEIEVVACPQGASAIFTYECIEVDSILVPYLGITVLDGDGNDITHLYEFTAIDTNSQQSVVNNNSELIDGETYLIVGTSDLYPQVSGELFVDCSNDCVITVSANYDPCNEILIVNASPPDADILLDGSTPLVIGSNEITLPEGLHTVTATHPLSSLNSPCEAETQFTVEPCSENDDCIYDVTYTVECVNNEALVTFSFNSNLIVALIIPTASAVAVKDINGNPIDPDDVDGTNAYYLINSGQSIVLPYGTYQYNVDHSTNSDCNLQFFDIILTPEDCVDCPTSELTVGDITVDDIE